MASNYERVSQGISEEDAVQYAEGIEGINAHARSLQSEGKLPVEFSKSTKLTSPKPEALGVIDLEQVVSRQVDRFVGLGFHIEVYPSLDADQAETKYRLDFTAPADLTQPEIYRGRFDVLLVVEPRIPLARIHKLAGIKEYIATDIIVNNANVPATPYVAWTHDGQRYRPFTVKEAVKQFADDEEGSPQVDVTDLYLQHPEYFQGRGIDAVGSQFGDDRAPYLHAFHGRPEVGAHSVGHQNQDWGALSRGKEIIKLGVWNLAPIHRD